MRENKNMRLLMSTTIGLQSARFNKPKLSMRSFYMFSEVVFD